MRKHLSLLLAVVIVLTIVFVCRQLSGPSDDVWYDTMDIVIAFFLLVPLVFTEISIYYNCLYFFTEKRKKRSKTILNILMSFTSTALLVAIFVSTFYLNKVQEIIIMGLLIVSVGLRILYLLLKK